ncbi:MAG: phosphatidylglycerol lysyltransferase domain-containing protein, partial [Candidatus Saccharimonadales bacterium]
NQIESFDPAEANIDILRHASGSPGNINDYLIMALLEALHSQAIKRLNLGLCPLAGLDDENDAAPPERKLLANAMRLLYANGDRFYSFTGLERFKAKYQPDWRARYIIYQGGTTGFLKTFRALSAAMKVKPRNIK